MHHAHNGPGIDRVLGEIKRDGASKEGSRAEQGRHFDSVLRFVITVQNAKVNSRYRGRRTNREMESDATAGRRQVYFMEWIYQK